MDIEVLEKLFNYAAHLQHIYSTFTAHLQHICSTFTAHYSTCTVLFCICAVTAHVLLCTVNVLLLHIQCFQNMYVIFMLQMLDLGLDLGLASKRRLCYFLCLFIFFLCFLAGMKSKRRCLLDLLCHIFLCPIWGRVMGGVKGEQANVSLCAIFFSRERDSTTPNVHTGCGYIKTRMRLYSKRCGYIAQMRLYSKRCGYVSEIKTPN